jgi:hypothetical protein
MVTCGRRDFLRLGAVGGLALLGGCGYYGVEEGPAYAPWRFPDPTLGPSSTP